MKKIFKAAQEVAQNGIPNLAQNENVEGFGFSAHGKLFVKIHDMGDNSIGINGFGIGQRENPWVVWFHDMDELRIWLNPFVKHHII
jgi:hypothetical protein